MLGLIVLPLIAYWLSADRKAVRLRTVGTAFAMQLGIAVFIFKVPLGQQILDGMTRGVSQVILAGREGIDFVFGALSSSTGGLGFVFAFQVLPVIIFFSSLIAVLYHLKVMDWVIRLLGGALQKCLGTSRAESLSAAANIFVGQTEAPLVVKPYIAKMTRSELFAVMVGGLATVAGSVLAGYVQLGAELRYLLAACFMAAPAGLLYAKIMMPETETPETGILPFASGRDKPVNFLDAAALGASDGMKLALNVGAMLLAFIGLIAVLNLLLGSIGAWFGAPELTLQSLLGYLFAPVGILLGLDQADWQACGSLIGQKVVVNEFVAFGDFKQLKDSLQPKSQAVLSVALCGFANLSSIAILLGGLGGMAPNRRPEIARFGLRAVLAATLANLTSAALTGIFI